MAGELPEDLVIHILAWLPVMSLMRFKCVSKSWLALVENSCFIAKHLNRPTNNNNHIRGILARCNRCPDADAYLLLGGENMDVSLDLGSPGLPIACSGVRIEMLSSCNGIICLRKSWCEGRNPGFDIALWNPATKQIRILPRCRFPCPPNWNPDSRNFFFGLGFDVKHNDYKLVRIICEYFDQPQVVVYSLSSDDWRLIEEVEPFRILHGYAFGVYLNGTFCWTDYDYDKDKKEMLISFDLSDEAFRTLPMPAVCDSSPYDSYQKCLTMLNGSVAIIIFSGHGDQCFDVWVLNESGAEETWTKSYTIGPFEGYIYPIGFLTNHKFFMADFNEQLFFTDIDVQELKTSPVEGIEQVLVYKESLVSIMGPMAQQ